MPDPEQDFTKIPSPPIRTDKGLADTMEKTASEEQSIAYKKRILKTWGKFNRELRTPDAIKQLPISYIHPFSGREPVENPGDCISLPLCGKSELRISRSVVREKEGSPRGEHSLPTLVIGATTQDAHGKEINIPDVELSPFWSTEYDVKLYPADELDGHKSFNYLQPAMRFLALFDPQRDIDWKKLGTPSDAQTLCLKALNVFPPPSTAD